MGSRTLKDTWPGIAHWIRDCPVEYTRSHEDRDENQRAAVGLTLKLNKTFSVVAANL